MKKKKAGNKNKKIPCICKSPPEQRKEKDQKRKKYLCPLHLQIASRENIQKNKISAP
jgi:hypothetical protein